MTETTGDFMREYREKREAQLTEDARRISRAIGEFALLYLPQDIDEDEEIGFPLAPWAVRALKRIDPRKFAKCRIRKGYSLDKRKAKLIYA